ncbi:hypothetical protein RJ55_08148 [Drechmeria coniospora]|nr:hypothetical protein RJ55_08148 [Drechmeria coniospora]
MDVDEISRRIEEAMDLACQQQASTVSPASVPTETEATKPSMPPARVANAGKTVDEVWAELNKSPLFMTELEENDDTAALQALSYEGTALENCADFKERGNDCFKVRGYADAREFYTKGVLVLVAEERKRARGETTTDPDGVPDSDEEIARQRAMLEALHVNRAACHLALANYRSCWLDCAAALRLNPRNIKACYRSARALLAVDRVDEADDVCAAGLALDPDNKPLREAAADIAKRARLLAAKKAAEEARIATAQHREKLLEAALAARNIPTRRTDKPPEMADMKLALVPDPDDPRSTLSFPTVLLYPLQMESDVIKGFEETQSLGDHLAYILPPPWDEKAAYGNAAAVSCFVETRDGGLLKMGKRVPLLQVLGTGRVEVVDEVLRIFVLPTAEADAWVTLFKSQRAAQKGVR